MAKQIIFSFEKGGSFVVDLLEDKRRKPAK
jgi:hypothetical protein